MRMKRVGRSFVSAITQTPASGPFGPVTVPPISSLSMATFAAWALAPCCQSGMRKANDAAVQSRMPMARREVCGMAANPFCLRSASPDSLYADLETEGRLHTGRGILAEHGAGDKGAAIVTDRDLFQSCRNS